MDASENRDTRRDLILFEFEWLLDVEKDCVPVLVGLGLFALGLFISKVEVHVIRKFL